MRFVIVSFAVLIGLLGSAATNHLVSRMYVAATFNIVGAVGAMCLLVLILKLHSARLRRGEDEG